MFYYTRLLLPIWQPPENIMEKKDVLTKVLAIVGTVFAWQPILAPILFSAVRFSQSRMFRFDYLMPAEFFPVALIGGILLLWAALRARAYRRLIGWSLGIAVLALVGGQALAVVTGLASGETEAAGLPWALVVTSLVVYTLALVAMAISGILLLRDLFKTHRMEAANIQS
jgi:multisubunit Na+/H+ antiporter MnhC subunit